MNRIRKTHSDTHTTFLAIANNLSDRAARAMCPNGLENGLATLHACNVITLQIDSGRCHRSLPDPWTGQGTARRHPAGGNLSGKETRHES